MSVTIKQIIALFLMTAALAVVLALLPETQTTSVIALTTAEINIR